MSRIELIVILCISVTLASTTSANSFEPSVSKFLVRYCNDCHGDGASEGNFDLRTLSHDLEEPATFQRWQTIYDRVGGGEMPPDGAEQPAENQKKRFATLLSQPLSTAHGASKSTVLRRLNRREYQNTLNDLFGINVDLESMLPEDARAHEFDNVGEALGLSMVHLQRYLDAAEVVLDTAIENSVEPPKPELITAFYKDSREAKKFIGNRWKLLDDGAVVRFSGGGYPSGMIRGSRVRQAGKYRVRIVGYAHQSKDPIAFSVGGTSFERGSERPIYSFFEVPPDEPTVVEFEAWIEPNYMLAIEPFGINDPERYKRKSIDEYQGPGLAIGEVTLEGPLVDEFPSRGHRLLFDGLDRVEIPPRNPRDRGKSWYRPRFEVRSGDVNESITRVAKAAFRRPVSGRDLQTYIGLYEAAIEEGDSVEEALRTAVTGILCSPAFLFLNESPGRLDGFAVAARLSYLFARTTPDEELLRIAAEGGLTTAAGLRRQTERLIAGPHFRRFITDFADSWLDLREIDFTAPDASLFPEFDTFLRHSMPRETHSFLTEMINANRPIKKLVASDFAMLNSRLAKHYELPAVNGVEIRKVMLPADSVRGGLLSQASILKVTANGTNTSPVTRGAWVMERIIGQTPPPPPPGIPGVEPDIRGATTLRELLDKHRDAENCRACHAKIDPPGFAMECFNPIGGFREHYRSLGDGERVSKRVGGRNVRYRLGPKVDASGELASGRTFDDFREFRSHLADRPDVIAKAFLVKFLTFATGRELGFSDRPEINRIVKSLANQQYRTRDLIHAAIQSDIFRNK